MDGIVLKPHHTLQAAILHGKKLNLFTSTMMMIIVGCRGHSIAGAHQLLHVVLQQQTPQLVLIRANLQQENGIW